MKKDEVSVDVLISTYNHYINNSLAKVLGFSSMIERDLKMSNSQIQEHFKKLNVAVKEISDFLVNIRDDSTYEDSIVDPKTNLLLFGKMKDRFYPKPEKNE